MGNKFQLTGASVIIHKGDKILLQQRSDNKRSENAELATIAGMLHDIYSYSSTDTSDHAHKGAALARRILNSLQSFSNNEIDIICNAIYNHSDKGSKGSPFDEVLIDADVMQHCLYNPLSDVAEHEKRRFANLRSEFGLQ